ncbi:MAG: hypothetical protein SGPRY_001763, partial [Prymnesium sp.]
VEIIEPPPTILERLTVPLAFAGWYLLSIVYSLLNKKVLTVWKFPCVFSAMQLLVGALFVGGLWVPLPTLGMSSERFASLRASPKVSREDVKKLSVVALWLALAYGTVAFTNVVKTLEPLFTCLFSFLFLGQQFALPVYLSLIPVIGGVAVASASEVNRRPTASSRLTTDVPHRDTRVQVSFSAISLFSGLASNVCFALRAISAKKIMTAPIGSNMNARVS